MNRLLAQTKPRSRCRGAFSHRLAMLRLLNWLFISGCLLALAFAGLCVLNYYSPTAGNALALGIVYVAAIGLAAVLLASPVVLIRWVANRRARRGLPTHQVKPIRLAPAVLSHPSLCRPQ
jgi:hypothetical protein